MPSNVFIAGQDSNGQPIYICRAQYKGGVHPGTLLNASASCNVSYDGKEYRLPNYEVLVDENYNWVAAYNGEVPFDAVESGTNEKNNILYVCRTEINSTFHLGTIQQSNPCIIQYSGQRLEILWYEVLIGN